MPHDSAGIAMLLQQFRKAGGLRFLFLMLGFALVALFYTLFYFDIRPDTTASIKATVENYRDACGLYRLAWVEISQRLFPVVMCQLLRIGQSAPEGRHLGREQP
jgi:hypothetical protein